MMWTVKWVANHQDKEPLAERWRGRWCVPFGTYWAGRLRDTWVSSPGIRGRAPRARLEATGDCRSGHGCDLLPGEMLHRHQHLRFSSGRHGFLTCINLVSCLHSKTPSSRSQQHWWLLPHNVSTTISIAVPTVPLLERALWLQGSFCLFGVSRSGGTANRPLCGWFRIVLWEVSTDSIQSWVHLFHLILVFRKYFLFRFILWLGCFYPCVLRLFTSFYR